jgi:hypothetical protein
LPSLAGVQIVNWEKFPPWPFQRLKDMQGKDTGIVAVCAPFTEDYYQVRAHPMLDPTGV